MAPAPDRDAHDARCRHFLVEDDADGTLVGCFRVREFGSGAGIVDSYAAGFYDLSRLAASPRRMAEIGRFCVRPGRRDPDIIRLAWAALTRMVDTDGIEMLFGCSSFAGTDPAPYRACFCDLRARHLAPPSWRPGVKAPEVVRFAALPGRGDAAASAAGAAPAHLPTLLRSYLTMGGRVSDHAVIDRALGTLHVFTGLEVAAVPPTRQKLLRALIG